MTKTITMPLKDLSLLVKGDNETINKYKDYLKGLKIKCYLCGKDFIPSGRPDMKYCKSCIDGGAQKAYKKKIEENESLKKYNREYQRRYARIRKLKGDDKEKALAELNKFTLEFRANESNKQCNPDILGEKVKAIEQPKMVQSFMKGGK